ncbi:MAG: tRNA (N6-isopentenyl adenosine(37)-C2)-methylthiotransferase MiaB [Chloroflexi bacterium AL-W]|nr:tRNA (N6-isopentenyl adenosine(37)-C2)-methylthiotransferase MiaB [Chloroflexi bacterium AL-N1]NOK67616.1 tRNA (N6-isopentenyl adenosine(37)-C2)-methylthiotransferase MiaB [Chloroflexi bacterium AL-N10]NOK75614.1 tRNA (N6-isopentenyl adenosine(37)-C2)-methylthiotransferase MiaB [Chloroflexi bacterium AL-N5]NOK82402.1 tRNA (N6-isopentenyl adenosine(37)-C2)-methylthiotransferase MiaB [Chloroflexi bacterium AL-W]NOK90247.1 tRNA (N6-isopentenyl adenosine(37)-C2)-methylthiotransferase MiaB [Chlor
MEELTLIPKQQAETLLPRPSRDTTPRDRRYYVWTVGCQMNVSDSDRLESALQGVGYAPADKADDASFIVLNSCSVRESAEARIIGKLGELQRVKRNNPDTKIVLWGCMVGPNNQSIFKEKLPVVDHFVSPSAVDEVLSLAPNPVYQLEEPALPMANWEHPPVSVHVPIQYGCNMSCAFCVIPLRRGREQSRPLAEVVEEVRRIVARGAKEITLLGQIVDSWGHDLPGRPDLADLLRGVHDMPGLVRLRFLTSHPAWMTDKLIATMNELPRCQPEINLPVQSGHDAMLKRMRRGYTVQRYRDLIERIRGTMPDISLTTDIIVGHPGETQACFEGTRELMQEIRFDKVHIAAFSARPGTRAADMEQDAELAISEETKHARRIELERIQEHIVTESSAQWLDKTVEVLVEGESRGRWRGRSPWNKLVFFDDRDDWTGRLALVHVTSTSPWSLQGHVIGEGTTH